MTSAEFYVLLFKGSSSCPPTAGIGRSGRGCAHLDGEDAESVIATAPEVSYVSGCGILSFADAQPASLLLPFVWESG